MNSIIKILDEMSFKAQPHTTARHHRHQRHREAPHHRCPRHHTQQCSTHQTTAA